MRARTCVPSAFEAAMTSGLPPLKRFRWVQPTAFRGHLKSFGSSFAAEAGNQESIGPRLLPVPSEMVNSIDTRQLHWKTTVPQKIPITMSRKSLLTVDFGRCLMFASRIYPIFYGEWVVGRKDTLDFCPVVVHYCPAVCADRLFPLSALGITTQGLQPSLAITRASTMS